MNYQRQTLQMALFTIKDQVKTNPEIQKIVLDTNN